MDAPSGLHRASLIATESVLACPVCTNDSSKQIASGFDYEYQTCANQWLMWQCPVCTHVWLNPRPAEQSLSVIYPSDYYSYDFDKRISPLAVRGKKWLDRRKLKRLLGQIGRPARSYLDVGCGSGRFLQLAEEEGLERREVAGIELDSRSVQKLIDQGFRAECGRVEKASLVRERRFDLVTMFHVIEHTADPRAVIESLASALTPGGLLALETPNFESLDAYLFQRGLWGGYHFPRHWHIFTPESLKRLLHQAGFDVVSVSYQTGHSFWLFSLHHTFQFRFTRLSWLAPFFHPLRSLPSLILATAFDWVRSKLGFRTSAMLVVAKRI